MQAARARHPERAADKVCVATCLARGDCWWGARRNVVGSLAYRW